MGNPTTMDFFNTLVLLNCLSLTTARPPARGARKERTRARRARESDEGEHASQERSDGRASGSGARSAERERQGTKRPTGRAERSGLQADQDKKKQRACARYRSPLRPIGSRGRV